MKHINIFLLSCLVHSATAFLCHQKRQSIHYDVSVQQHSWHDSDFYNSQGDVTSRPLHDKGASNYAYDHDNKERFSASLFNRGAAPVSGLAQPVVDTYPPVVESAAPVPEPVPALEAPMATPDNNLQQENFEGRIEALEQSVEEIKLVLNHIASILDKEQ